MSNFTEKGLLSERPAPSANPAGYYYATDEGKYYKSNGEVWAEVPTDFDDINPRTSTRIIAGLSEDGTVDVVKLDNDGNLKVAIASELNVSVDNLSIDNDFPGFNIPNFDEIAVTYFGTTNNVNTVTYKLDTVTVATLTFAYDDDTQDDARITSVTKS